jgi:hypothetical protein
MARRKQGNIRSFLNWFNALSSMDKVGVILMLFTGVAFIAKLLEGMHFATPLPKGCEDFRLEPGSLSPLDPRVRGVVIGEVHRKTQTEKCLIAIEKQRKVKPQDPKVYFVEGISEGLNISCPMAPMEYKSRKNLRCIGWDLREFFQAHLKYLIPLCQDSCRL